MIKKITPDNLIGKCIVNLYEKVTLDYNGLDQGALYLSLDTGEIISFPLNLEYQNQIIKSEELEDAISIFNEIKQQNADWTIKDLLELSNSESLPYVELQCGLLFTEISISPNGTGMVGYKQFQTIEDFELYHGKDYIRLSEK